MARLGLRRSSVNAKPEPQSSVPKSSTSAGSASLPRLDRAISGGFLAHGDGSGADAPSEPWVVARVRAFAIVNFLGFTAAAIWYHWIPIARGTWNSDEIYYLIACHVVGAASLYVWRSCYECNNALAVPTRSALFLFLLSAFAIAVPLGPQEPVDPKTPIFGIPWVCVHILIFPLLVPLSPRRHIVFGVLVALFWPIGELTRYALGAQTLPMAFTINFTFAGLLCASLSALSTQILALLTGEIDRVRAQVRELGSYRLEKKLGEGGMGEVWQARHKLLARPAAVKLVRTDSLNSLQDKELLLERFEREARATAKLRSHHTVEVYDFGRTATGEFYYAMELLEGVDLQQLVQRDGPQPIDRVVSILAQICLSLMEAHGAGLVHRDIKPANVFLCREGHELDVVKLLDFGLVVEQYAAKPGDRSITGTPDFMPPESADGAHALSPQSDLYSLGCVGYWLLTADTLFHEDTPHETLIAHVEKAPPSLAQAMSSAESDSPVSRGTPIELAQIIDGCLAKLANARPSSAEVVRAQLLAITPQGDWPTATEYRWWSSRAEQAGREDPLPGSASPGASSGQEILPTRAILPTGALPSSVRPLDETIEMDEERAPLGAGEKQRPTQDI